MIGFNIVYRVLLSFFLLSFQDAEPYQGKPKGKVLADQKMIKDLSGKARDTIVTDEGKYVLDAYAWRNFQPGDSDTRLRVINKLISADSKHLVNHIDIVEQFVMLRDSLWTAGYDYSVKRRAVRARERMSTGGPRWECQERISVVARVHDSIAHRDYFLRAKDVIIECVE